MYYSGIADEAGKDLATQIRAHKELGWSHIEMRTVDGVQFTDLTDDQFDVQVAMDSDGDFVVAWSSFGQDGSGYGVYARRYDQSGTAQDATEFRVNQTTLHYQQQPAVSMDSDGNFVVTWTTTGQDNDLADDNGVYARQYNADGSDVVDPGTGLPIGEWRINATVEENGGQSREGRGGRLARRWQMTLVENAR